MRSAALAAPYAYSGAVVGRRLAPAGYQRQGNTVALAGKIRRADLEDFIPFLGGRAPNTANFTYVAAPKLGAGRRR